MDMWYFARICVHARSWREFAKCRFAHFPSFFSVHVDTYDDVKLLQWSTKCQFSPFSCLRHVGGSLAPVWNGNVTNGSV